MARIEVLCALIDHESQVKEAFQSSTVLLVHLRRFSLQRWLTETLPLLEETIALSAATIKIYLLQTLLYRM